VAVRGRQVLPDLLAEKAAVGDGLAMVDGDRLDRTGGAVAEHIGGCAVTVAECLQGPLRYGAHSQARWAGSSSVWTMSHGPPVASRA
jgi:hypothetical protein